MMSLPCPRCQKQTWHTFDSLDYEIKIRYYECRKCGNRIPEKVVGVRRK